MRKITLLLMICISFTTFASTETGKIQRILINRNIPNVVLMTVASSVEPTKASCVSGWEWAIDISTETGRAQYALALALYMGGKSIVVNGSDICETGLYANAESVNYVYPQ